jgi:hypothetical protein
VRPEKNLTLDEEVTKEKIKQFLISIKDTPCLDCGIKYPHYVMDFDHIEQKLFSIGDVKNRSFNKIKEEIKKCELVCSNCHRIRTWNRIHPTFDS